METETEVLEQKSSHKPQVFVNSITFNDGTVHQLTHSNIVVFTGANNSGKSQVLRDIELHIKNSNSASVVLSNLTMDYVGDFDDDFIASNFKKNDEGNYWCGSSCANSQHWKSEWNRHSLQIISTLFVNRLNTEERLTSSKSKPLYSGASHEQYNSLHTVYELNEVEDKISKLFNEAFGEDLVVNRRAGTNVSLHVGKRPSWEGEREGRACIMMQLDLCPFLTSKVMECVVFLVFYLILLLRNILLHSLTSQKHSYIHHKPESLARC